MQPDERIRRAAALIEDARRELAAAADDSSRRVRAVVTLTSAELRIARRRLENTIRPEEAGAVRGG